MLTLNEIVTLITDVGADHDQVAATGVGDLAEWNPKDRDYPLLWVHYVGSATEEGKLDMTFRVGCFDRVIMGEEGEDTEGHEQEVLSDTQLILLDVVAFFVQGQQTEYFSTRVTNLTPATERTDDRLAGHFVDLTISQDWDFNKCQVPATFGTPASSVDGLTLYDFCDQSVLDRLTSAQEACLSTALCGTPDPATVNNNATPTWSHEIDSGDVYTLPQGKMLDSDGSTTVTADYIPAADGFMFTATPCAGALPATITGGSTVGYGEAMTIGVSESYATYTWVFSSQTYTDQNIETTGQNPTPTLQWDGTWDVKVIVEDGSGGVGYATTTVTVLDGLRYADLEYVPNTGPGGYTGTDKLFTNEDTFFWNGNNNFVIVATADTLSGDGGMIFRAGVDTIRTMGYNTVQDDSGTKNEYLSSTMKWAVYDWGDTSISVKDGGSFPVINTVDLSDMKWFRIDRVGGDFKLYTADNKDDSSWTLIHGYSKTSTDPLYVIAYLHGGTKMCYSQLLKYGDYV